MQVYLRGFSPKPFCKQLVEHVSTAWVSISFPTPLLLLLLPLLLPVLLATVRQSRSRRNPALVPEFKTVLRMVVQQLPSVEKNERFYKPGCGPAGLLSSACVRKWGEEMHVRVMLDRSVLLLVSMSEEFTDAALGLDHPFDALDALDDDCKRMLFDCAVKGPSWMCQQRAATLSKWLAWTNELQVDKEKLHDSMEQESACLGSKRILLLERIAGPRLGGCQSL